MEVGVSSKRGTPVNLSDSHAHFNRKGVGNGFVPGVRKGKDAGRVEEVL